MNVLLLVGNSMVEEVITYLKNENLIQLIGVIGNSFVEKYCREYRVKYYGESLEESGINLEEIDLIVSWLYDKKIKEPYISNPKLGCINFHPAPLPEYRGRGGCNLAILEKLSKWGVTAHYVNEDYDKGDIIKKTYFDFDYRSETAYSLKKKTNKYLLELFKEIVYLFANKGKQSGIEQSKDEGRYLSKKQMLDLMRIDIEKDDIENKIQAFWFPPYTGAYIEIKGKKYTLVNEIVLKKIIEDK